MTRIALSQSQYDKVTKSSFLLARNARDTYSDAAAWLRDFADQKNIKRGRVMCGGFWFAPQQIEAVRERARKRATRAADLRPGSSSK